jgi:hypothetical protein
MGGHDPVPKGVRPLRFAEAPLNRTPSLTPGIRPGSAATGKC